MITTLGTLFAAVFSRDLVLARARELGATKRLRDIHPADVARSLVECALGDEHRSIATARRRYGQISGFMPEESVFYKRFNRGLATLMKDLFGRALEACSGVERECLAKVLGSAGIVDLLAVDGSQVALPSSAAGRYPSTDPHRGGVKLTALLSVLYQRMSKVVISNARMHDRRALKLPRWLHGMLILMDRGYCDRKLFTTIADRGGFFLTRLKKNNRPVITAIRSGLSEEYAGRALGQDLPFNGEADLDAEFTMPDGSRQTFRIVRLVVPPSSQSVAGSAPVELLFATNLRPDQFSTQQIATLYRFRWEVERLFAVLKSVGRLDHLRSANPDVVEAFMYATLLGVVLAMQVCALMRREEPSLEPSLHRVTSLVLGYLPKIASALGTSASVSVIREFVRALWREGVNPNPGRPYTVAEYELDLAWQRATQRLRPQLTHGSGEAG